MFVFHVDSPFVVTNWFFHGKSVTIQVLLSTVLIEGLRTTVMDMVKKIIQQ